MAKKTLTLYLAKPDIDEFDQLLSDGGREKLADASTRVIELEDFGDAAKLYIFVGRSNEPRWLRELRAEFDIGGLIRTRAACGALMFRVDERVFAATFAHGWMYLDDLNVEGDFGLKVALNALDDKKLKRLERANLGDAMRGVSLSPFQRDFSSFGLDDALDLVRKISGAARDNSSADSLSGAKSLKVSGEYELDDLPEIAAEALEFYQSRDYQATSFRVIDVVTPVTDRRLINELNENSVESIRNGNNEFELGLPSSSDVDGAEYSFNGPGLRGRYPDLLLQHYVAALGDRIGELDVDALRSHRIVANYDDDALPDQKWPIRTALVGSIIHQGGRYATNEGEWYRVDEQFRTSIQQAFNDLILDWEDDEWRPLRKIYDERGNGHFESEANYNREIAEEHGYLLLDRRLVQVPNVQRSGFEACDLLDIEGRRLIHVKKSSRRSSVLSHFFKQGSNAAQQLRRFPGAIDNLKPIIQDLAGRRAANNFVRDFRSNDPKWTVEYVIADTPRAEGTFNIPFFSKITLRDEGSNLSAMNYNVALRFIGLEPENI